jgi:hypothetical protein
MRARSQESLVATLQDNADQQADRAASNDKRPLSTEPMAACRPSRAAGWIDR